MTDKRKHINPHEGASPAVDAYDHRDNPLSDILADALADKQPQPARHKLPQDLKGIHPLSAEWKNLIPDVNPYQRDVQYARLCNLMADALDAQAAEIAELRKELEYARGDVQAEREDLEFETKRSAALRKALEAGIAICEASPIISSCTSAWREQARAALKGTSDED